MTSHSPRILLALLLAIFFGAALTGCGGEQKITVHPLIGLWRLTELNGKPLPSGSAAEEHFMTFFEKELTVQDRPGSVWAAPIEDKYGYVLPRGGEIDITRDGQTRRGIYAVKGDTLTMAMCEKSKVEGLRPLDFLPREEYDYKVVVMTFKRHRKEAAE